MYLQHHDLPCHPLWELCYVATSDMTIFGEGIHSLTSAEELDGIVSSLRKDGWMTYFLPQGISDAAGFFDAIRGTLPLDPQVKSDGNWDALLDSLWSGLDSLSDKKILIVWPDARHMQINDSNGYSIATEIFASLSESLADPVATVGVVKEIMIIQAP